MRLEIQVKSDHLIFTGKPSSDFISRTSSFNFILDKNDIYAESGKMRKNVSFQKMILENVFRMLESIGKLEIFYAPSRTLNSQTSLLTIIEN